MIGKGTALVYRQSDPVRLFLGENPHYIALEDEVFKKSTVRYRGSRYFSG